MAGQVAIVTTATDGRPVGSRGWLGFVALSMAALSLGAVLGVACSEADESLAGLIVAEGFEVSTAHDGIEGPTQVAILDDGTVLVGAINGGENDRRGQVQRINLSTGEVEILRSDLDKPTGLTVVDDELWIMERDRLSRGPLQAAARSTVVVEDLPNNGRSQGTLTATPEGLILFNTSGSKRGSQVVPGSGRLFSIDPSVVDASPIEVASGFKHAYAHAVDRDGSGEGVIFVTEMSDGTFDGERAADEVVEVEIGADHGWPRCVGDNRPVLEFGGSAELCATVPSSVAVFNPGATPTSIAWSPFAERQLLVALWVEGRVVSIDLDGERPVVPVDLVTGLAGPQHLATFGDEVLLTEFGSGRLLRLSN